ncbi:KR domain-containing protein, partial [Nonomuraea sp. NPDC049784]|uniref:KR domain-containing protein n=1 Tax=Nonomuraea sp. NPDC049784 TaxID=3154361 RepID=UPI0033F87035
GWLLHRLCTGRSVSRLVYFSSAAACLGWRLGGHYAAANGFLDALAHERSRTGDQTLSVGWGAWGMPDSLDVDLVGDDGFRPMPPDACLAILGSLLAGDVTHRAVAAVDWPVLAATYRSGRAVPVLDSVAGTARLVTDTAGLVAGTARSVADSAPSVAETAWPVTGTAELVTGTVGPVGGMAGPVAAEPATGPPGESPAPIRGGAVPVTGSVPAVLTGTADMAPGANGTPGADRLARLDGVDGAAGADRPARLEGVDDLRRMLRAELAAVLRIDDPEEIDTRVGLFELGLDSAMSVELRSRIEGRLSREVPPTLVFEYPTVEELAVALAEPPAMPYYGPGTVSAGPGPLATSFGRPDAVSADSESPPQSFGGPGDPGTTVAPRGPRREDAPHRAEAGAEPYGHGPLEEQDELIRRLAEKLERLR